LAATTGCGHMTFGRRCPLNPLGQFSRQSENGQVVRRQPDPQFLRGPDLAIDRDLGRRTSQREVLHQEAIGPLPILLLVISLCPSAICL
jgi:hypothetical protein